MGRADSGTTQTMRPLRPADAARPLPLGDAWTSHPLVATVLVVLAGLLPAVLALVVTSLLAQDWPRPRGFGPGVAWWTAMAAVAWVIVQSAHVVTRRLLPLAALLRLGLAFPGATPSRFRLALHAGNPRRLERTLASVPTSSHDDASAAGLMLELVSDLSDHDRSTRGHSERVRAYTELLGAEMGVSADDRQRLRWAGLLHDIGKLETPASILNKPGALSDEEFERIRQHPLDGLRLAMPLWAWLGEFVLAVSDHHERWEGGGYPSGAKGADISRAGRIVAVADAFDVMTSSRSYKKPISVAEARAELVRCSGTQFDPDVVRAFLAIDLRDLRKVIGVFALLAPIPAYHRHVASFTAPARHALGAAGVAAAVTLWSVVAPLAPADEHQAAAPTVEPGRSEPARTPPSVLAGPASGPSDPSTTSSPPGTVEVSGLTEHAGDDLDALPEPPGPVSPPAPPPTAPPTDPGSGPEQPPARDQVGVTIDPEAGAVDLDGVSPSGPIELVELPAVGSLACGTASICSPIEIVLPITLPF